MAAPHVAAVDPPDLSQRLEILGRFVGDRHQRQVGEDEPRRDVGVHGPALAPGGDRLGDTTGGTTEGSAVAQAPPRQLGHVSPTGPVQEHLALLLGPLEAAEVGELRS